MASQMHAGGQMHDHAMMMAKVPAKVFYNDPRVFVDACEAVAGYYGMDAAAPFADVYNFEAEALGQSMIYSDRAMPTIDFRDPLIKKPADLATTKIPDWAHTKRVPYVFEYNRLAAERGMSAVAMFCGPFSLAVGLRSYPLLIRDIKRNPAFAHELMTWIVDEVLTPYCKALIAHSGARLVYGADAWSAYPNIAPDMFTEWVVNYDLRLSKNLIADRIYCAHAPADYIEENLDKFDKEILWRCFGAQMAAAGGMPAVQLGMGRTHEYPLERIVEYLEGLKAKGLEPKFRIALNARLLRDGPVEAIVDCVKRFVKTFARYGIDSLGAASIAADTPPEHVHAMVAAVHTYGSVPMGEDLDKVPFQMPERESFEEYLSARSDRARFMI